MAKGLDDLIQHLLEEIALSGSQGVTLNDIAAFTSEFYHEPNQKPPSNTTTAESLSNRDVAVDRPFLSKIWTWLGRHPDVSIGDGRKYNAISLADLELQYPGYLGANGGDGRPADEASQDPSGSQPTPSPAKRGSVTKQSGANTGPRIRVNDERIYQAICGHPPDPGKVSVLEFDLLSHIAAARSDGILQGDLRQASGQDKRSVPKRTDALQKKGYIVKETVYRKGNKTSRLILKKFASNVSETADSAPRGSIVRDVVRRIFDVLSRQNLLPQKKLADELSLESVAEAVVLLKILRRLERLKCIKRVRTATGPSATAGDLEHFVQLLHPPGSGDLESFDTEELTLDQSLQDLLSTTGLADQNDAVVGFPTIEDQEGESGGIRHMARWNPDRHMANVVVDAVQLVGRSGLTNWNARRMITGVFVRRTIESLLQRISSRSLVIQPPHLRHLAVIRTSIVVDGVTQYLHYSWDVFRQMAVNQEIDIDHIPGARQALQDVLPNDLGQVVDVTPVKSATNRDECGFLLQAPLALQYRNGEAHFEDIIRTAAAADVQPRPVEPVIVATNGVLSLDYRDTVPSRPPGRRSAARLSSQKPVRASQPRKGSAGHDSEDIPIGRPRKYLKGTEKFWRLQFSQARAQSSGSAASNRKGLMQDPAGLALYARRPPDFDETLVKAINAGLPVPALNEDINDAWVTSTKNILGRQSAGAYISPQGVRAESAKQKSQIMIIKTPRLRQADFVDRSKVHQFRFISSMVAHSSAYRRFYPTMHVAKQRATAQAMRDEAAKHKSKIVTIKTPRLRQVDFVERSQVHHFRFISSMAAHSFAYRKLYPSMHVTKELEQHSSRVALDQTSSTPKARRESSGRPLGIFPGNPFPEKSPGHLPRILENAPIPDDVLMETTDEEPESTQQTTRKVNSSIRTSVYSMATGRQQTSQAHAPPPSLYNPDTLTAQTQGPTSGPISALPEAPSERQKLGLDAVKASHSTQCHSVADYPENTASIVARTVAPGTQDIMDITSPIEAFQQQLLLAAQVNPDNSPLPVPMRVGEVDYPSPDHDAVPTIESPHIRLQHDLQVADQVENGIRAYVTPDAPLQPEQTNDTSPAGVSMAEDKAQRKHIKSPVIDNKGSPVKVTASRKGVKKRTSRAKSQPAGDLSYSSGSEAMGTATKPQKSGRGKYTPGANALCRQIVLQLVSEASGVAPNDPSTLKRISAARWQEAGGEDRPLLKAIKVAIKALCESGKLKQAMFTFRGKTGIMVKRAVLCLPTISPLSDAVEDVKQKMIDAEPADYIPPEWMAEGSRAPLVGKNAPRTLLVVDGTPLPKRRRASSAASASTVNTRASKSARSVTRSSTRQPSPSPSPSPPPPVTAATGFLTLKVPSLGALPVVQMFNWRTEAPVRALRFDSSTPKASSPKSAVASTRGRGGRKPANRAVVWANQHGQNFPESLQDILLLPDLKIKFEDVQSDDIDWQRFASEVEGVRAWEERETEAFQSARTNYAFINHIVPSALYSSSVQPSMVEFASLTCFDENGFEGEVPYPTADSWAEFVSVLQQSPETASRIAGRELKEPTAVSSTPKAAKVRRSIRPAKRKLSLADGGDGDDDDSFVPKAKRRRPGIKRSGEARARPSSLGGKLSRGVQYLRALPGETVYRIAVSVIVVRTLAGGIDGYIDWPLVMTVFPDDDEDFIKGRWFTLSHKYRSDIRGLTDNLQWKYLQALESGEVPSVNFQDLKATDWPGIVDWAMTNLDKFNSKEVDDLPESLEQLLDAHNLNFDEPRRSYHLLGYNAAITNPLKEGIAGSIVFGTSHLPPSTQATPPTQSLRFVPRYELQSLDPAVRLARSWVFATVLTPETTFNPSVAHAKLSTLAPTPAEREALLTRALRMLQDAKLIQRANQPSEQLSTVRGWEGGRKLYEQFDERRMINVNMLRRAVKYKLGVFDAAYRMGASVIVEKNSVVNDGDMVAVLNLMAAGHIRPKPGSDVPNTRYGIDHERNGYRTRNMDKKLLGFSVEFVPTGDYVFGDPKREQRRNVPIPRGAADEPRGLIPPWIDIQGNLQSGLWDMFLAGVIGLVVQLPGITAIEISRALGFALDQSEVQLVLDWCIQAGFSKMDMKSMGYETTEDWWWCISAAEDEDGD